MKHLVQTNVRDTDILIGSRFIANRNKDNSIEWKDKEQGIATGRTMADYAQIYVSNYDDNGNRTTNCFYLNQTEIKAIYDAMQEIETITTGKEDDDLPF